MAQSLIACPLCSAASFSSTNALCLSLVNVASKWLRCTLCEEELRGLDKLTIHLLGHLIHTTDFETLLSFTNTASANANLVLNPEPLNLVKTQSDQLSENENRKSTSAVHNQFSLQPDEKEGERPSLKIDDEVMIFFNSNDKDTQNKTSNVGLVKVIQKPYDKASSPGLPKFSINLDRSTNFRREIEESLAAEGRSSIINDAYFNVPSTNQVPNNIFAASTSRKDSSIPINETEPEMDISSLDKDKENPDSFVGTGETRRRYALDTQINESDIYSDLGREDRSKSSFLSPKGERVMGYRCDICSLVFPDANILSMHRQLIHIELNGDPAKTNGYKCHLCSKSFVMKGSLMVHMRVAHFGGAVVARLVETKQLETDAVSSDLALFLCSICSKGFRKEQQLTQHEKLHDGKQCDVCFKTFTTKYFLRKHKRLHTGEMPYTCSICNKSFTFQQSYHKHLLYHSDDKPYTCGECGRAFKELSTLHNHQRIHTGEKPFSCEACGKCFRQRVSYLVHRRIHTGVMPYRCQECGKTFRYKVSERTHKCIVSTPGGSTEASNLSVSDSQEVMSSVLCRENAAFQKNAEGNGIEENEWIQEQALEGQQKPAEEENVMRDNYPEPRDFFSLVMSPSDRLQHLSLSGENVDEPNLQPSCSGHDSIDTEALKELLYDVADYN